MATGLSSGYIYLIEAQDRGEVGDDFIVDNAGDPEDIDLDNYTEGTDYVYLSHIHRYNKANITGVIVNDLGAGKTAELKMGKRSYAIQVIGDITSFASAKKFSEFVMADDHTESTSFDRYYLIYKRASDTYDTFVDGSGNVKEYCKGIVSPQCTIDWQESKPLTWLTTFIFRSVW